MASTQRESDPQQPREWPCPACRHRAATAATLASHLRAAHLPVRRKSRKTTWACPHPDCREGGRAMFGPLSLALHLGLHRKDVAPEASGKPGRVHFAARVLELHSREELLALDWAKSNTIIGRVLGVKKFVVEKLREVLRSEGHDIPTRGLRSSAFCDVLARRREEVYALDWTQASSKIAAILGIDREAARSLRAHLRRKGHRIPYLKSWKGPSIIGPLLSERRDEVLRQDWTHTNREIGEALGVSPIMVREVRRRLRKEGHPIPEFGLCPTPYRDLLVRRRDEVLALDWSRPNAALASVLGVEPDVVRGLRASLQREGHAIPNSKALSEGGPFDRFLSQRRGEILAVDWSRPNREVAGILGVPETTAWRLRRRLRAEGVPIPREGLRGSKYRNFLASRRAEVLALDWGQSNAKIASALGVTTPIAEGLRNHLRRTGHPIPRSVHGLPPIPAKPILSERREELLAQDWGQTDATLGAALGLATRTVRRIRLLLRLEGHALATPSREAVLPPLLARLTSGELKVDWGQDNVALGAQLGVASWTIRRLRGLLRKEGHPMPPGRGGHDLIDSILAHRLEELLALDWTQFNMQIGELLGIHPTYAGIVRRALREAGHSIPLSRVEQARKKVAEWIPQRLNELLAVDWTQPRAAIAARLGTDMNRVSKLRHRLQQDGHPIPNAKKGRSRPKRPAQKERYVAAGLGRLPDRVVAEALGLPRYVVSSARRYFGMPAPPPIDWEARREERKKGLAKLAGRIRSLVSRGKTRKQIMRTLHITDWLMMETVRFYQIPSQRPPTLDWGSVDWTRSNADIARDLGVPRERVANKRTSLRNRGLPVPFHPTRSSSRAEWNRRWGPLKKKMRRMAGPNVSPREIARRLDLRADSVQHALDRFGIPYLGRPRNRKPLRSSSRASRRRKTSKKRGRR